MLVFALLLLVALLGWLVSEFWGNHRLLRVALGILAITMVTIGACVVNSVLHFYHARNFSLTDLGSLENPPKKAWTGHWENNSGFWLIVDDLGSPLGVLGSGNPAISMHSVSLSDGGRVLTFKEGKQWAHKLTLKSEYEASHEWFDAKKQALEKADTMYKLVRPVERRATAQQPPEGGKMT
jgi:hypothetical protein